MAGGDRLLLLLFALFSSVPSLLAWNAVETICAAIPDSPKQINGRDCKDVSTVVAEDFYSDVLTQPGQLKFDGTQVTFATSAQIPALNSIDLSLVRADLPPNTTFPPHTDHVAELMTVITGTLRVGLLTGYPNNKHIVVTLKPWMSVAIPAGVIHYLHNDGATTTTGIAAFNGANIRPVFVTDVFSGDLSTALLAQTFRVDSDIIQKIQAQF